MVKVLLVDDDQAMGDSTKELLSGCGHEVIFASSGMAAITLSKLSKFDVVVTDMLMPDMDGFEVIKALRALHPNLKIIAMSGARKDDKHLYLSAGGKLGADALIEKPFHVDELLAILDGI